MHIHTDFHILTNGNPDKIRNLFFIFFKFNI